MTKQTNRKPGAIAAANATAPDAYTRITNRIVADLDQGVRPWCKPWGGDQLGARISRPRRANGAQRLQGPDHTPHVSEFALQARAPSLGCPRSRPSLIPQSPFAGTQVVERVSLILMRLCGSPSSGLWPTPAATPPPRDPGFGARPRPFPTSDKG